MRVGRPERVEGTQALRFRQMWCLVLVPQTSTGANRLASWYKPAPACPPASAPTLFPNHTGSLQMLQHTKLSLGPPTSPASHHWPCQHLLTCADPWSLQSGLSSAPSSCESLVTPLLASRLFRRCALVMWGMYCTWVCAGLMLAFLSSTTGREGRDHMYVLSHCILRTEHRAYNIAGFQWVFAEWMNYWQNFLATLRFSSSTINQTYYHITLTADGRTEWDNLCKAPHSLGTR